MKASKWMEGNNQPGNNELYELRLFITGASPNSIRAVDNIKTFCETHLKDKYQLEIIDVHQQPEMAQNEQIIALPLLIKKGPGINKRLIGDMSNTDKLLDCFRISL